MPRNDGTGNVLLTFLIPQNQSMLNHLRVMYQWWSRMMQRMIYFVHYFQQFRLFAWLPPQILYTSQAVHPWKKIQKWVKFKQMIFRKVFQPLYEDLLLIFYFLCIYYLFLCNSFFDTHTAVKASSRRHNSFFLQFNGLQRSSFCNKDVKAKGI